MRGTCVLELKSPLFQPLMPQVNKEFAQKAVLVCIFPRCWQGCVWGQPSAVSAEGRTAAVLCSFYFLRRSWFGWFCIFLPF